MRQVRASFLLLLFITSFARCWADSNGLLGQSTISYCDPAEHSHDCAGEETEHKEHHEEEEDKEDPIDNCSTCLIVKAGFTASTLDLNLPTPFFADSNREWNEMLLRIEHLFSFEDSFNLPPPVPPEQGTVLLASRIVTTSAVSVRGPNLV